MDTSLFWIKIAILLSASSLPATSGQAQQNFKVTPHDMQVLEGTEALLRCEVTNKAGQVQWTKDGFALGFSAVIVGYPRYSVIVDAQRGIYNLRISNTSLEDDAEYQCQVGPAKGNPAIRANAKLNVIAPPTSIKILGHKHHSKIEVIENQLVNLTCVVENAKPAAEIIWYRGDVEFKNDKILEDVDEALPKRFTTTSQLLLQPTAEDDYLDYSCKAKHKALAPDVPMRSSVELSVLYPPGMPFIEGYSPEETLRRGQSVQLHCRSRGGNPPAELAWFKNGQKMATVQRTSGRLSENVYTFTAEASDNLAKLSCEARNSLSATPLTTEVVLSVLFSPVEVAITGSSESKVGENVPLTCSTSASNPPAEIHWTVGGRQIKNTSSKTFPSPEGGWITTSKLTVTVEPNKRSLVVICHGLNMQLTENIVKTHTVNVLYPPSPPVISGYTSGQVLAAGLVHKLLCVSSGGNPPPTLAWYKNDKRINSVTKVATNSVSAEISILVNATDNQARYKCEVQNSATEIPFFETKTLDVHFPPETVKIRVEPKELRPGTQATLICDSSSSNPPAVLSWWKDGIPVEGANPANKPGLWSGTVSTLELRVNVTQDMDGVVYTCQSANDVLQRNVHETVSLDIYYPPKFSASQQSTFVGVEGEPLEIVLDAKANPMTMTYTWTKDGFPIAGGASQRQRIIAHGPVLNLASLHRNDAGTYLCEAMNSQGTATTSVTVLVEYPPTITSVSDEAVWNAGDDAILSCTATGNPLGEEHIRWERKDYDMSPSKTTTTFANGTSYLHIKNVQRDDVGNFTCIADNRKGDAMQMEALLVVKFSPEINKSPGLFKYAAKTGDKAVLRCRVQAAPEPRFTWQRDGINIKMQRRNRFKAEETRIDSLTYESVLYIDKVAVEDFGEYECVANNELGQVGGILQFNKPSRPDTPVNVWVTNVSDSSVSLEWTPGFDGGLPVYFRYRFRELKAEKYSYGDVRPNGPNVTIYGLKPNTVYLFSVMAANEAGGSKYHPDIKRALSKGSEPISAELLEKSEMPSYVIMGVTSAALVLLILNATLVAWCVTRRQNKNSSDNETPNDDAYSKDDTDSDYKESGPHKKAASTYLVENVDIIQSASFPPKYQEKNPINSSPYGSNMDYTRTLPNPKRFSNTQLQDNRAKDDHMLVSNGLYIPSPSPASSIMIKGNYVSSPSPAPPPDGSYFNMSDKYLSYPPIVY